MAERRDNPYKEYVAVIAVHWTDGRVEPLRIQREDGTIIPISKVLDVRQAASMRAGGQGLRYLCRFFDEELLKECKTYLFHDGDAWFVEKEHFGQQ